MPLRFPRTLVEAFPQHYAWRGVLTRHRRPLAERIGRALCNLAVLGAFALIGCLLAWRG